MEPAAKRVKPQPCLLDCLPIELVFAIADECWRVSKTRPPPLFLVSKAYAVLMEPWAKGVYRRAGGLLKPDSYMRLLLQTAYYPRGWLSGYPIAIEPCGNVAELYRLCRQHWQKWGSASKPHASSQVRKQFFKACGDPAVTVAIMLSIQGDLELPEQELAMKMLHRHAACINWDFLAALNNFRYFTNEVVMGALVDMLLPVSEYGLKDFKRFFRWTFKTRNSICARVLFQRRWKVKWRKRLFFNSIRHHIGYDSLDRDVESELPLSCSDMTFVAESECAPLMALRLNHLPQYDFPIWLFGSVCKNRDLRHRCPVRPKQRLCVAEVICLINLYEHDHNYIDCKYNRYQVHGSLFFQLPCTFWARGLKYIFLFNFALCLPFETMTLLCDFYAQWRDCEAGREHTAKTLTYLKRHYPNQEFWAFRQYVQKNWPQDPLASPDA